MRADRSRYGAVALVALLLGAAPAEPFRLAVRMQREAVSGQDPGNLSVDTSCINCDVCRMLAGSTFSRAGIYSGVTKQPATPEEELAAYQAVLCCPSGSIKAETENLAALERARDSFPLPVDEVRLPGVYLLGHHSLESDACTAYLIQRTADEGSSVMVDCPRFDEGLARRIESDFGGLGMIFITHKDNGRDSEAWKKRFPNAERVLHRLDVMPETKDAEQKIMGSGPWVLESEASARRLKILWTPGHTYGSLCLLYEGPEGDTALFSGGHIGYNARRMRFDAFAIRQRAGADRQVASLRALLDEDFNWLLPSHGRRRRFEDDGQKRAAVLEAIDTYNDDPLKSMML